MKAQEFCYWLQGLFEFQPDVVDKGLTPAQTATLQQHLALVFRHEIDPSYSPDPTTQAELQAIHDGEPIKSASKKRPRPGGGLGGDTLFRC